MSVHLSPQQISDWLIGEQSTSAGQHLSECPFCQAEVNRMKRVLGGFRIAVRDWSSVNDAMPEQPTPISVAPSLATMFSVTAWSGMAVAAVALCLFVAHDATTSRTLQTANADASDVAGTAVSPASLNQSAVHDAISDAALLQQVQQQLSRIVPGPMQPLYRSVSKESSQ